MRYLLSVSKIKKDEESEIDEINYSKGKISTKKKSLHNKRN